MEPRWKYEIDVVAAAIGGQAAAPFDSPGLADGLAVVAGGSLGCHGGSLGRHGGSAPDDATGADDDATGADGGVTGGCACGDP